MTTKGNFGPAARICRKRGWEVGTRLVGDEGYGPTVIEITALGRENMLAVALSHKGEPQPAREALWTLGSRDWQPVGKGASHG